MTGDVQAQLVTLACSNAPQQGRVRWRLGLLADTMMALGDIDSLSNVTVHERLKKTNLNPGA